jgi:hypothetical protein
MTSLTTAWPAAYRRVRRARRLSSSRTRERLAKALEALVRDAYAPPRPFSAAAPINREEIRRRADLLRELAAELRAPAPSPRGVEYVERLLKDGGSPVYNREAQGALGPALHHARAALLLR